MEYQTILFEIGLNQQEKAVSKLLSTREGRLYLGWVLKEMEEHRSFVLPQDEKSNSSFQRQSGGTSSVFEAKE